VGAIFAGFLVSAIGCGSDTAGLSGYCEVIYATSNPPGSSGIQMGSGTELVMDQAFFNS
jgi:hypothetical protein